MLPSLRTMWRSKKGSVGGEFRAAEPLVRSGRALVSGGEDSGVAHNGIDGVVLGQRAVEGDAAAERLDRLIARMREGRGGLKGYARSAIAEREVGGVAEPERAGQVEAGAGFYHLFRIVVRLLEGGGEFNAGPLRTLVIHFRDGDRLLVGRGADGDLVARGEAAAAANLDVGGACAGIGGKIGAACLAPDAGDGDGLDAVALAVDVETDLVTDGDAADGGHLDVGRAGGHVGRKVGLHAGRPDGGDGGQLVMFEVPANDRVGGAV